VTQQLEQSDVPGHEVREDSLVPTPRRGSFSAAVAVAVLAVTAAVPLLGTVAALLAAACVVVLLTAVVMPGGGAGGRHEARRAPSAGLARSRARGVKELVLYLSPVLLLAVAVPLATSRITRAEVDGVSLTELLLASSLTVPWLSQAVCLPMYRAIGHLMQGGDTAAIEDRFLEVWPRTLAQTLPVIAVFAVPVELAMRWPLRALAAYLALCVLHTVFVQSLIVGNVGRRRGLWALAWAAYAVALLVAPAAWFLPPVAGLATQLVPLRTKLTALRRMSALDGRDVALDLVRGLLLGSVLWADKLFVFLRSGPQFAVSTLFLALLPAIIAYNYYFVRLAPTFDQRVLDMRHAMEHSDYERLRGRSSLLAATVQDTLTRTALIGAALSLAMTTAFAVTGSSTTSFVASVCVASCLFVLTTLACYKLDYIGLSGLAQLLGAAHLALCVGVFALVPATGAAYIVLALLEAPLCLVALACCRSSWRASAYTLFWRHATAW
jgi:hypothetical protein